MTRQQFRLLVVINQIILFASHPVGAITDSFLPPELAAEFGVESGVMAGHGGGDSSFGDPLYVATIVLNFVTLVAAAGLFFAQRWGRTLYLLCFVIALAMTILTPFYLNTGWSVAVGTLYGLTEGMILGLVYFSHLRRMFERRGVEEEEDGDEE